MAPCSATLLACLALLLTAASASAQAPQTKGPSAAEADTSREESEEDEDSAESLAATPRAALTRFFELSRRGDYEAAARFLDLPASIDSARAPDLAKRLRLTLDQLKWIDLTKVSAANGGAADDGLASGVEEIARIPIERSLSAPVRMVRRIGQDTHWLFSRATVARIDDWYASLPNRVLLDSVPEPLLRMGPKSMLVGQWVGLPLFVLVVGAIGVLLGRLARLLSLPLVRRTSFEWDDALLERIAGPLAVALAVACAYALLPMLGLYAPAHKLATRALRALFFANFFWGLARSVDVAERLLERAQWGQGAPSKRTALMFASRFGKTVVAAFAIVALFSELGYPVTSLLAGLGVGGIAVALSAQKSLENLLGAFAIAVDQPLREGDFVRVDNMLGTVEKIGMRSTRIRTLERTMVSIPNGKLAEMRIETFGARDRIRLWFTFGLVYSTTERQLRDVITDLDALLCAHPKLWTESRSVRFKELGESALVVEVSCWFVTTDFDEFTQLRQEVLLGLMRVVERHGAEFAFPTRTLQVDPATLPAGQAQPDFGAQPWESPPNLQLSGRSPGSPG